MNYARPGVTVLLSEAWKLDSVVAFKYSDFVFPPFKIMAKSMHFRAAKNI